MISVDGLENAMTGGFANKTELPREGPLRDRLEEEEEDDDDVVVVVVVVVVKDSFMRSLNTPV